MFEDATFESTGSIHTHSRDWMAATFALNGCILLALVVLPLLYPEALPRRLMTQFLSAPPPPAAANRRTAQPLSNPAHSPAVQTMSLRLDVPVRIHPLPRSGSGSSAPISGGDQLITMDQGFGIPGGNLFGNAIERPKPVLAPRKPVHISSGVAAGLLLQRTLPIYPAIAKAARVEGVVVLQATISTNGAIANLRVLSGPQMLAQSAVAAVQGWRYRPFLLNGEPVAVETTIHVVYALGH